MPGRFAQSFWISLAGSMDDVHEIDVAFSGAAVVFGSFWVRSVKKLRCSQKQQSSLFCRNELVSYDSLLLVVVIGLDFSYREVS